MSESTRQPHERPSVPGAQAVWKGQQHYGLVSITFSKGPGCTPRLPQGAGASTRRVWGRRARAGGVQTNRPPLCRPQLPFSVSGFPFQLPWGWRAAASGAGDEAQELSTNQRPRVRPRQKGERCQLGQWKAHVLVPASPRGHGRRAPGSRLPGPDLSSETSAKSHTLGSLAAQQTELSAGGGGGGGSSCPPQGSQQSGCPRSPHLLSL